MTKKSARKIAKKFYNVSGSFQALDTRNSTTSGRALEAECAANFNISLGTHFRQKYKY